MFGYDFKKPRQKNHILLRLHRSRMKLFLFRCQKVHHQTLFYNFEPILYLTHFTSSVLKETKSDERENDRDSETKRRGKEDPLISF